ncbi:hypothetical protein F5B22DRAFT_302759 [Xylaria bambusicola]|uniref:uncharacterized protein n=1 Tax=Xylaria bambusicola TaxID=326684 RepID=UPI0020086F9F|nr:uncharacterized protein F5B22DRAFT_302759 [Xylaria bambusicola]KAI0512702.1 hypothetical protein F5B22DRAFT_302759 [Xylaria bambusicola]
MVPIWVDGRILCRRHKCNQCVGAPEFVPIHYDCYQIFRVNVNLDESEALNLLWTIGSWRNPWPRAQPIYLSHAIDQVGLERISEISGLSDLRKLPPELVGMIRDLSPHQLFWRSIFVISLSFKIPQSRPLSRSLLNEILSWERGAPPVFTSSAPAPPLIRLTIDAHGINKIERLHEWPVFNSRTTNQSAFIVEHIRNVSRIHVEFKGDFSHLCLSENQPSLCIWNTCSPPRLSSCSFLNPAALKSHISSRLYVRDLGRSRGITFFFASGQLFGIHIHLSENSCAMDTYNRISIHRRQRIVWVYVPISPLDRPLGLGSRKTNFGFKILIQMSLAGEIILGRSENRTEKHVLLGSGTPMTLIYGEPQELQPISIFGAYPSPGSNIPLFEAQEFEPDIPGAYFSWAPLSHIQSVNTFYDGDTRLCKGIIFHYRNGGSRALGQCRLNVDQSIMVIEPCVLCFQSTSYSTSAGRLQRHGVRVEVTGDDAHEHSDSGWKCLPLRNGVLTFSFTEDSSYMSLREEPRITT